MATAEEQAQNILVFLFFSLFVGAVITYLLSRLAPKIPYTVIIFALGSLFAFAITGSGKHSDVLAESLEMWNQIPPDLILFVFLPALLFGEAMSLNFHHVKGALPASLWLAGPGALFGTIAIAVLIKYSFPYGWGWELSLVFGAIVSATDPVAVVALLKSAGASTRLTYIVIGEALLNDGTALVLYSLLFTLLEHGEHPLTAVGVTVYFLRVIFLSPLLGLAFGFASLFFISLANKRMLEEDGIVQLAVTICCAYLSFYVAQQLVGVSGVISCVVAGVVLARYAGPMIVRAESMKSIWEAFEWIGNTLIFTLAGLIIGSGTVGYIHAMDLVYILVAYLLIFVVRSVMLALSYPIMARIGKGCSVNEAIFMSYGGLRGAVSVALALALVHATEQGQTKISTKDARRCFFIVGGVAAMTLLINASTSGLVLNALQLLGEQSASSESKVMLQYAKKRIRLKALGLLEKLQAKYPDFVDPALVLDLCSIFASDDHTSVEPSASARSRHRQQQQQQQQQEQADAAAERPLSRSLSSRRAGTAAGQVNESFAAGSAASTEAGLEGPQEVKRSTSGRTVSFKQQPTIASRSQQQLSFAARSSDEDQTIDFDRTESDMNVFQAAREIGHAPSYNEVLERKIYHIVLIAGRDRSASVQKVRQRASSWYFPDSSQLPQVIEEEEEEDDEKGEEEAKQEEAESKRRSSHKDHFDLDLGLGSTSGRQHQLSQQQHVMDDSLLDESFAHSEVELPQLHRSGSEHEQEQPPQLQQRDYASIAAMEEGVIMASPTTADVAATLGQQQSFRRRPTSNVRPPLPPPPLDRQQSNLGRLTRALSFLPMPQTFMMTRSTVQPDLIKQIRRAFLEVVRVSYWRQITSGRLPRKSNISLILLNSIDNGLETTHIEGLQDWEYITQRHAYLLFDLMESAGMCSDENSMDEETRIYAKCIKWFTSCQALPSPSRTDNGSNAVARSASEYRHAQAVYLLVGFVEAHEYAQRKIPFYLGETEGIDTPEEELVVRESQQEVTEAKRLINLISREVMTMQLSKQAARWILHMQEDQISEFQEEGILTGKHAEEMLEEVQRDFRALRRRAEWSKSLLPELWEKLIHWLATAMALLLYWFWTGWCGRCYVNKSKRDKERIRRASVSEVTDNGIEEESSMQGAI